METAPRLRGLSLFSGLGGLEYGLREWVQSVGYVEMGKFERGILQHNIKSARLDAAPLFTNVKDLKGRDWRGRIDLITAGFPCQDASVAGIRKGLAGKRTRLVFDALRLAEEASVPIIFLENVKGILANGGVEIIKALTSMGYDARWCVVSAADCGAPHTRERWFCLAFNQTLANPAGAPFMEAGFQRGHPPLPALANSKLDEGYPPAHGDERGWENYLKTNPQNQPALCCGFDGLPARLAALRALGNACIPQQAALAFKILLGIKT